MLSCLFLIVGGKIAILKYVTLRLSGVYNLCTSL